MYGERARQFAVLAHRGQKYGEHPYSYHLDQVAQEALLTQESTDIGPEIVASVAYLHDVIEDTHVSEVELRGWFDPQIVHAVALLSKKDGMNYEDYIAAIRTSRLALLVKQADTLCNYRQSFIFKNEKRQIKYAKQLMMLLGG